MLIVGLTGGICSGKSTTGDLFRDLSIKVIDADKIGHLMLEKEFDSIMHYFGSDYFNDDGTINRVKLRELIFSDEKSKSWLENLIHPLVKKEIDREIICSNSRYTVIESAILLQANIKTDVVLSVICSKRMQTLRLKRRDLMTNHQIKLIREHQQNFDQLIQASDDIILNDGSLDKLNRKVVKLDHKYTRIANGYR